MALNLQQRSRYASRICAGTILLKCGGETYLFVNPTPLERLMAEERYAESFEEASYREMLSLEDSVEVLQDKELWSAQLEEEYDGLPDRIENLKVDLWGAYFKQALREKVRKQVGKLRLRYNTLFEQRHQLEHATQEGVAKLARNQYLLGCGLRNLDGSRIWKEEEFLHTGTKLIDSALTSYVSEQINETIIRELAHSEPWRTVWIAGKAENSIFGQPSSQLNEEQKAILLWSRMYDAIAESTTAPPDDVISDDDVLDGWLVSESRKQTQERLKALGESKFSDTKGDAEVFIPAEGADDFKRIEAMNDLRSRMIKKQRMDVVHQKGTVKEQHMPDSRLKIRQKAIEQFKEHTRRQND